MVIQPFFFYNATRGSFNQDGHYESLPNGNWKNQFQEQLYEDLEGPTGTPEKFYPHVIDPTWGVDRSVLVTLLEAYHEDGDRVYLCLPSKLAPY